MILMAMMMIIQLVTSISQFFYDDLTVTNNNSTQQTDTGISDYERYLIYVRPSSYHLLHYISVIVTGTYYHFYRFNVCQSVPFSFPFPSKVMEIHILSYYCTVS